VEKIDIKDALFLLVLNASEESSINDIKSDFENWDTSEINVPTLLESLIKEGVILFALRSSDKITDYTMAESIDFVSQFDSLCSHDVMVFLTESGFERWDNDTWGITTERAHHLMFSSNGGKSTRVQ